jgi:Ca2+-binding EF-hand superfamily protein
MCIQVQIWDRKRRVPNHLYRDPLATLFEEFDADGDGSLTVDEILNALKSEGVEITRKQVEAFMKTADSNENKTIELHEFSRFVFSLADQDAHKKLDS